MPHATLESYVDLSCSLSLCLSVNSLPLQPYTHAQFVEELGKLQDRVPAFSADKAAAIVEADLGQPVSKLFRSFDSRPIAAASLGQVCGLVLCVLLFVCLCVVGVLAFATASCSTQPRATANVF